MKKLFIITGEASADLHTSNVVKELKRLAPGIQIKGVGGDLLKAQGMELIYHINDFSSMGFIEVFKKLRFYKKARERLLREIDDFKPDAILFVDFSGFNLNLAKKLQGNPVKKLYFIAPKVWAWNYSRIKKIKKYIDKMLLILPFEKEIYNKEEISCEYVGNPTYEEIHSYDFDNELIKSLRENNQKPLIAVLPGSRKQELAYMLPILDKVAAANKDKYNFVIGKAPTVKKEFLKSFLTSDIPILEGQTYNLLMACDAALTTSGTIVLEAAAVGKPAIVVYRLNKISHFFIDKLIRVDWISLPNIILNEEIYPELLQNQVTKVNIEKHLDNIFNNRDYHLKQKLRLEKLGKILKDKNCFEQTAENILYEIN